MKQHHKRHIIINLIIIILSLIAVVVICGFIQIIALHKDYVDILGYSVFSAETGRMSPTIEKGDIVIVNLKEQPLQEKDIITYKNENAIITHRIEKIDEDTIIAKRDNNNTEDKEKVRKNQVLGKIIHFW